MCIFVRNRGNARFFVRLDNLFMLTELSAVVVSWKVDVYDSQALCSRRICLKKTVILTGLNIFSCLCFWVSTIKRFTVSFFTLLPFLVTSRVPARCDGGYSEIKFSGESCILVYYVFFIISLRISRISYSPCSFGLKPIWPIACSGLNICIMCFIICISDI